jgi:hypothetical protein
VAWHIKKAPMKKIPQTPEGRLFGHIEEADWLTAAAVTFQLWDLVISILIPEHCTAVMIGHHIMAALVAWYGLNNQVGRRRHRVDAPGDDNRKNILILCGFQANISFLCSFVSFMFQYFHYYASE